MEEDFDNVMSWYVPITDSEGEYVVELADYGRLLKAYKELKHRMEGLEK